MVYRVPSGLPAWVRKGIALKPGQRAGAFMSAEQVQRLVDLAAQMLKDFVAEYEIGVDYSASRYASSDVSFNARIFRDGADDADIQDADDALAYFVERGRPPRGFDAARWFPEPFTEFEAKDVLLDIAESGAAPAGYRIEAVDWRREEKTSIAEWRRRRTTGVARKGDEGDLFNFGNIIRDVGAYGIRIGAVKRNRL